MENVNSMQSQDYILNYDYQFKLNTKACFIYNKLFSYLDIYYLKKNKDMSVYQTAMSTYKKGVFQAQYMNLLEAIFTEIKKDRNGEVVNTKAIRTGI